MLRVNILLAVAFLCTTYPWCKRQTKELKNALPSSIVVAGSVLNESVPYCPYYGYTCHYSYDENLSYLNGSKDHPACCERCESDPNKMRCCSEVMPCINDRTNDQGQNLVCIRTVSDFYDIGVLAVATCPEHSNDEHHAKCVKQYGSYNIEPYDVLPVRDVTTRTLYRNIFCAFCNGIDIADIIFWQLSLGCDSTTNLSIATNPNLLNTLHRNPDCYFKYKDPEMTVISEMCTFSIGRCHKFDMPGGIIDFSQTTDETCLSDEKEEVIYNDILFWNQDCAVCNGVYKPNDKLPPSEQPSFSMLLAFDEKNKYGDPHPPSRCERGTVYIRAKRQCVEARCSFLRQLRENVCERTFPNPDSFAYRIGFRLFPQDRSQNHLQRAALTVDTAYYELSIDLENQIRSLLLSVFPSTKWMVFEMLLAANVEHNDPHDPTEILSADLVFYEVRVKLVYQEAHDPEEKLLEMIGLEDAATLDIVKGQHNISFKLMLTDDKTHFVAMQNPQNPLRLCFFSFDIFYPCLDLRSRETFKTYKLENLTAVPFAGRGIPEPDLVKFYSTPITSERSILELRKCPFVKITRNEMDWTATKLGLEFLSNNSTVPMKASEYVYGDSSDVIWVCLETYEQWFGLTDGSVPSCSRADYILIGILISSAVY